MTQDDLEKAVLACITERGGIFSVRYRLLTLAAAGTVRSEKKRNRLHYYTVER